MSSRKNLRLASFDDGDIRGLSQLEILSRIMYRVNQDRPSDSTKALLPCEYFNLICGSGTGGLIAILFAMLRMSVEETIEAFRTTVEEVYVKTNITPKERTQRLQKWMEDLMKQRGLPINTMLMDKTQGEGCLCFVVASSRVNPRITLCLRNYTTPRGLPFGITMIEAVLATCAAQPDFAPVASGLEKREYCAATWAMNPIHELIIEAHEKFGGEASVASLLSLGAGHPGISLSSANGEIVLQRMMRDIAQQRAEEIEQRMRQVEMYSRFSVETGLQNDCPIQDPAWVILQTEVYLDLRETKQKMDVLAQSFSSPSAYVTLGQLRYLDGPNVPDLVSTPVERSPSILISNENNAISAKLLKQENLQRDTFSKRDDNFIVRSAPNTSESGRYLPKGPEKTHMGYQETYMTLERREEMSTFFKGRYHRVTLVPLNLKLCEASIVITQHSTFEEVWHQLSSPNPMALPAPLQQTSGPWPRWKVANMCTKIPRGIAKIYVIDFRGAFTLASVRNQEEDVPLCIPIPSDGPMSTKTFSDSIIYQLQEDGKSWVWIKSFFTLQDLDRPLRDVLQIGGLFSTAFFILLTHDKLAYKFRNSYDYPFPVPLRVTLTESRNLVESAPLLKSHRLPAIHLSRALLHLTIGLGDAIVQSKIEGAAIIYFIFRLNSLIGRLDNIFRDIAGSKDISPRVLDRSLGLFFYDLCEEQPGVVSVRHSFKNFKHLVFDGRSDTSPSIVDMAPQIDGKNVFPEDDLDVTNDDLSFETRNHTSSSGSLTGPSDDDDDASQQPKDIFSGSIERSILPDAKQAPLFHSPPTPTNLQTVPNSAEGLTSMPSTSKPRLLGFDGGSMMTHFPFRPSAEKVMLQNDIQFIKQFATNDRQVALLEKQALKLFDRYRFIPMRGRKVQHILATVNNIRTQISAAIQLTDDVFINEVLYRTCCEILRQGSEELNSQTTRSPDRILLDRTKEDEAIRLDLQELHEAISQRDSLPPTLTSSDIEVYRLGITPDETPLIIPGLYQTYGEICWYLHRTKFVSEPEVWRRLPNQQSCSPSGYKWEVPGWDQPIDSRILGVVDMQLHSTRYILALVHEFGGKEVPVPLEVKTFYEMEDEEKSCCKPPCGSLRRHLEFHWPKRNIITAKSLEKPFPSVLDLPFHAHRFPPRSNSLYIQWEPVPS